MMHSLSTRAARISLIGSVVILFPQAVRAEQISIPFNASNFSNPLKIDNKFFTLTKGSRQFFRGRTPGECDGEADANRRAAAEDIQPLPQD